MKVYKVRRISDGLFHNGGNMESSFSEKGKTWNSKGAVNRFLSQHKPWRSDNNAYHDYVWTWELVEYEIPDPVPPVEVSSITIRQIVDEKVAIKAIKESEKAYRQGIKDKEDRKKQYLELKKEFDA